MKLTFLFRTSEFDSCEVYKNDEGEFFEKRFGIPMQPINYDNAKQIAWLHLNREEKFPTEIGTDGIKRITCTKEQQNAAVAYLLM